MREKRVTTRRRKQIFIWLALTILLILAAVGGWNALSAFAADRASEPERSRLLQAMASPQASNLRARGIPGGGARVMGMLDGRQFSLMVPRPWNGQIIFFVHGYTIPGTPVDPPATLASSDLAQTLNALYGKGYAVAFAAYGKGGYAVQSGAENTARLRDYLSAHLHPSKAYALGASMGGSITLALLEQLPNRFDGAMAVCGVVDGWESEMKLLIDTRAVYDYFTRNTRYALPGDARLGHSLLPIEPEGLWKAAPALYRFNRVWQVLMPVVSLFRAAKKNPNGPENLLIHKMATAANIDPEPSAFLFPLALVGLGMDDMVFSMHGVPYGNSDVVYHSVLLSPAENEDLNRGIQRLSVSPEAVAYVRAWHQAQGSFSVPLVTLHNQVDPLVPRAQETALAAIAAARNRSGNLLQITVPSAPAPLLFTGLTGLSHCGFKPDQVVDAFNRLTRWVETGARPSLP